MLIKKWKLTAEVHPLSVQGFAQPSGVTDCRSITVLVWIMQEDKAVDGLIYGTAQGYFVCWKEVP